MNREQLSALIAYIDARAEYEAKRAAETEGEAWWADIAVTKAHDKLLEAFPEDPV